MAKKVAKGGNTAKEAFYKTIDAIKNMQDPVEQSVVGVDLFGTMWEDLGPQVVTQLGSVRDAYDKTKDSAEQLNEQQYDNLGDGLKALWRTIQTNCLEPIQTKLMPKFNEIYKKVKSNMPEIKSLVSKVLNGVADSIEFLLNNMNWLVPVAGTFLATMLTIKGINTTKKAIDNTTKVIINCPIHGNFF